MILAPDQPFTDPPCLSRRASSTARFDLPTPVVPQIAMRGRNAIRTDGCVKWYIYFWYVHRPDQSSIVQKPQKPSSIITTFSSCTLVAQTQLYYKLWKKWPSNEQEIKYDKTHYVSHGNTGINGKWVITAQQSTRIIVNKSQITICSGNLCLQDS